MPLLPASFVKLGSAQTLLALAHHCVQLARSRVLVGKYNGCPVVIMTRADRFFPSSSSSRREEDSFLSALLNRLGRNFKRKLVNILIICVS